MKEIIAYHGWGFSASFWDAWQPLICGHWQCFDRGYFSQKNASEPFFQKKDSFKIVLAHSLGLHFVSKEILASLDLLIILSGFSSFQERPRAGATFALMQKKIKENPLELLQKFYGNCGLSSHREDFSSCNPECLLDDLQLLQQSRWDGASFLEQKKALIFHGKKDRIIPFELGERLHASFPSLFFSFDGAHVFQKEEIETCAKIIEKETLSPFKKKVQNNFSKAAESYSSSAHFAAFGANELERLLHSVKEDLPLGPILEVGAGTGFVSEKLAKIFPKREVIFSDLSSSMLEYCQKKLSSSASFSFVVLDGEKVMEREHYAMIVSALTVQWFEDMDGTIRRWFSALKPGGVLLFSFLEKASFEEWESLCRKEELPFTKNALPDLEKLRLLLLSLDPQVHLEEKLFQERYSTLRCFFQNLKNTGAVATKSNPMSLRQRKRLLTLCQKNRDLTISYRLVFAKVEKR